MEYRINKGIGKNVEFKGLQAQYLVIFAVGLLAVFFAFVFLYLLNVPTAICIGFLVLSASFLVYMVFKLNKKYGQHGLMKIAARKTRPRFIISRKPIYSLFKRNRI